MTLTPELDVLRRRIDAGSGAPHNPTPTRAEAHAALDALRARVAALEEAGERLAATVESRWMPDTAPAEVALARWREVRDSGAGGVEASVGSARTASDRSGCQPAAPERRPWRGTFRWPAPETLAGVPVDELYKPVDR